jgi:hypothetical protein
MSVSRNGIQLKLDVDPWLKTLQNLAFNDELRAELYGIMDKAFEESQSKVPVRTDSLRRSGQFEAKYNRFDEEWHGSITYGGYSPGGVHNPVTYAAYVLRGTRPHEIRPRTRQYLRFVASDGRVVFTKLVHHPGTKAQDYMPNKHLLSSNIKDAIIRHYQRASRG